MFYVASKVGLKLSHEAPIVGIGLLAHMAPRPRPCHVASN